MGADCDYYVVSQLFSNISESTDQGYLNNTNYYIDQGLSIYKWKLKCTLWFGFVYAITATAATINQKFSYVLITNRSVHLPVVVK